MQISEIDKRGNEIIGKIWADIQRLDQERIYEGAQKDPQKYRDTLLMERGKNQSYVYWENKGARKGQITRWCRTKNRNAAGFYLTFIEVWKGTTGQRFAFIGHATKNEATEDCRTRLADSKKPKAEQKYNIPTFKRS